MALKIWMNTGLVDEAEARVSVFDHGLLYGDGVFEGIRVYHEKVFELAAHIKRLFDSAHVIRLPIVMSREELSNAVETTVKANGIRDGYVRLVVTRGVGTLGLNPFVCKNSNIIIIADTIQLYPEELYEKGMKVVSATTIRTHPLAFPAQVKSLNYLNNIMAKIEAINAGVYEAIMLNSHGFISECTGDNIFIVSDGRLLTPALYMGVLEGITRDEVMALAARDGIEVRETTLTRHDVFNADECFLTGTAAEIIPVVKVDGRLIGDGKPGPVTRRLMEDFRELVRREGVPV